MTDKTTLTEEQQEFFDSLEPGMVLKVLKDCEYLQVGDVFMYLSHEFHDHAWRRLERIDRSLTSMRIFYNDVKWLLNVLTEDIMQTFEVLHGDNNQ